MKMTMQHISKTLNSRKWKPSTNPFEGLPIRPSKKKTRLFVDNEFYERGYAAAVPHSVSVVYNILAKHANHRTQTCYPAAQTIMELAGVKNRRTIFDAIRILEAFDIIAIVHSQGRVPNHYALLDVSAWKQPNSSIVETVKKTRKTRPTVSANPTQPSQSQSSNSGTDDTRSHRRESVNEIKDGLNKTSIKGTELLQRLSPMSKSLLTSYFCEDDIVSALEEICEDGAEVEKLGYKPVLVALHRRGAVPTKELPSWIKN